MTTTLLSSPVASLLHELHAAAQTQDARAKQRVRDHEAKLGRRLPAEQRYALYGQAPLAIARDVGELLHLLTVSHRPTSVLEFGTSHGISTIYLAAALRDLQSGSIITTEIDPDKAQIAEDNLLRAGLADLVDIRVGDALQTLEDAPARVDLLFLDGRNDLYLPVLQTLETRLAPNALVIADLSKDDPELLPYRRHLGDIANGYLCVEIPLGDGVMLSIRLAKDSV
jgi:predicted O-methyltransferase YrrM